MTKNKLLRNTLLMCALVALSYVNAVASTHVVSGNITTNTTWTSNNRYIIVGFVYVTNNATLTINAGTVIEGDSATLGSLIITRGAKINAVGTPCKPIIFTSEKPAGQRHRGDWGGVILEGYAPVNWPGDTGHIEGIVPNPLTLYGGGKNPNCGGGDCPDVNDNSGVMQYCRIEFAGVALAPNNEINGLTMGGVGAGTTIDHIQVSYSNDDSYEWFGGTVNCKYLIAYDGIDDDFDTDNGFSGKVQFGLGMRDPNVADVSGSKSFESDNDPTGTTNTPQTSAKFANITALGGSSNNSGQPLFKQSAHIRRNSNENILNSILMGFPQGLLVDGSLTILNCAGSSFLKNCYLQQASGSYYGFTPTGDVNEAAATSNLNSSGNVFSTQYSGVLNNADFPISNISNMIPASGNPLPAANNSVYGGDPFFTSTSYVGAFNPSGDTWAGDWTNFDPVNATYPTNGVNFTPTVSGTVTNAACANGGAVDVSVSGGVSPYVYSWSNGATTQDISGVSKGSYIVTVKDAGGDCSANPKTFKVKAVTPLLTSCNSTSSSITVFRSGNLNGFVTGYQLRYKKSSVSTWGPWASVGNANSFTTTGLLSNTSYDFEIRGICPSGYTALSAAQSCSTTLRLANDMSNGASVTIYPNPTMGQFNVDLFGFKGNIEVKVLNTLGQVVYSQNEVTIENSSLNLDLSGNAPGIYQVEVSDADNHILQSIVLQK